MKDFLVNTISSLVLAAAAWAFNRYALGHAEAGIAEFWAALGVVALIVSLMVTMRLNRLRDAYVAAHSVDHKFFADPAAADDSLASLSQMFGRGRIDAFGKDTATKTAGTEGYVPAARFFARESPFMRPGLFECRALRNGEKAGKVFVQLSFVPVDEDGRTILVLRDPLYHGSEFGGRKRTRLAFLSFSPIPTRFHVNSFEPVDAYRNEVPAPWGPLRETRPVFEELGAAIRFGGENKATYLFYVFAVRYPGVRFSDRTDGTPNLKWLFYRDEDAWRKRLPFGKDHDSIAAVASVAELQRFVRRDEPPTAASGAPFRERLRVRRLRTLLRRYDFAGMERQALQDFFQTTCPLKTKGIPPAVRPHP